MRAEREIKKKIKVKEDEVLALEIKLLEAKAHLSAWKETIKLLERVSNVSKGSTLQSGSMVYKAHKVLQEAGKALHIKNIVEKIGLEQTKKNRVSLSSSLAGYVRNESIFNRPAPNTFGLLEFKDNDTEQEDKLPDGFGQL